MRALEELHGLQDLPSPALSDYLTTISGNPTLRTSWPWTSFVRVRAGDSQIRPDLPIHTRPLLIGRSMGPFGTREPSMKSATSLKGTPISDDDEEVAPDSPAVEAIDMGFVPPVVHSRHRWHPGGQLTSYEKQESIPATSHQTTVPLPSQPSQPRTVRSASADLTQRLPTSANAMVSPVLTESRIFDANKGLFSQDAPSVAGLPIGMDAPGSKSLSAPQLLEAFQTVDPTSAALIEELRRAINVEDLTGQFEHTRRSLVARGGYSEVYTTHWRCHAQPNLIPVCRCIASFITPAH